MMLQMYTVYDSKANAYLQPFFMQSKGLAIRGFSELVNEKDHTFNKYPQDFVLFELGTFNVMNGTFLLHPAPVSVGTAMEYRIVDAPSLGDRVVREYLSNTKPTVEVEKFSNKDQYGT